MQITVHLPDDLARRPNPGREALESLALEGYKSGALSHFQAAQLLTLSRLEFEDFLKRRGVLEHAYSVEDLDEDTRVFRDLQRQGQLKA